jgi:PRTRC genetic system protein B
VNNGVPTIEPGQGITKEAYAKMMMDAAEASDVSPYTWTAENSVVTSPRLHAWWTPAQLRWMHFESNEIKCTQQAHNPALLWVAMDTKLYIYALKESTRPRPDTELFVLEPCAHQKMATAKNGKSCSTVQRLRTPMA